jgi:xylan 1,4-beta-xylosidase
MRDWQAMGSPEPPTREQTASLRAQAMATRKQVLTADANGTFAWQGYLDPWSVVAIHQQN